MALRGIENHPDLWFEDGNVVLIAEYTGFRVFKGVLARYSEVFRDMFQIPQPIHPEESFDGCPVVHLAGDRAEEVAIVLDILFGGGHECVIIRSAEMSLIDILIMETERDVFR